MVNSGSIPERTRWHCGASWGLFRRVEARVYKGEKVCGFDSRTPFILSGRVYASFGNVCYGKARRVL